MKSRFNKLIVFLLVCICILTAFSGCNVYEVYNIEPQPTSDTIEFEKETVDKNEIKEAFSLKLEDIKDLHPAFNRNQKGFKTSAESNWFAPKGVMCGIISDFDLDGQDEMAVFYTQVTDVNSLKYNMFLSVYEYNDGVVSLADDMLFDAYINTEYIPGPEGFGWDLKLSARESLIVNTKIIDEKNYIICEHSQISSAFGDGQNHDFWILRYNDDRLYYEASYTQTEGGSSGFEYTGYEFEDGIEENASLYCAMNVENALYDDYDKALSAYFDNYGLKVKNDNEFFEIDGSVFESKGMIPILTFTNDFEFNANSNIYYYSAILSPNSDLEP